jgi:formate-dependent nitrite reductase cytochrome c552 subunit
MKIRFTSAVLLFTAILLVAAFSLQARAEPETMGEQGIPQFFVPPPPLSEGIFPCSDCHNDMEVNANRRILKEFHDDIALKNHDEKQRWCLDCHNPDNRDMLRLANGEPIRFEESYYLCGQCHGTIFRDWKAGVHGLRDGDWDGKKVYRLCVSCHNPHQPRFKPLKPEPPPVKPEKIR